MTDNPHTIRVGDPVGYLGFHIFAGPDGEWTKEIPLGYWGKVVNVCGCQGCLEHYGEPVAKIRLECDDGGVALLPVSKVFLRTKRLLFNILNM